MLEAFVSHDGLLLFDALDKGYCATPAFVAVSRATVARVLPCIDLGIDRQPVSTAATVCCFIEVMLERSCHAGAATSGIETLVINGGRSSIDGLRVSVSSDRPETLSLRLPEPSQKSLECASERGLSSDNLGFRNAG